MKTKLENRPERIAVCGWMAVGVFATGWLIGSGSGRAMIAGNELRFRAASAHGGVGSHSGLVNGRKVKRADSLDPALGVEDLGATEAALYKGSGRNIFQVPAVQRAKTPSAQPATTQPDPPRVVMSPPPIGLSFFGFSRMGGVKRIFLSKDEDVFIAGEGDIVDRRYRIVRVSGDAVEVEDVLNNHRQMIFLTRG